VAQNRAGPLLRIQSGTLFTVFKYTVYVLLAINIFLFFAREYRAALLQFADGIAPADLIEAFASTIDTAAWVILLLLFELETRVLDDRLFTPTVTWLLRLFRALCYTAIVYAFYGYVANLIFTYAAVPLPGIDDLCTLVTDGWFWTETLDQYAALSTSNCGAVTSASEFQRFPGMDAAVDHATLTKVRGLAWIDAVNGAVWILVVVLLEIDVWLQKHGRYEGFAFRASYALKAMLYGTLACAVLFWMWQGEFKDWWDALLWLVAFVFIELNVFQWHEESSRALDSA